MCKYWFESLLSVLLGVYPEVELLDERVILIFKVAVPLHVPLSPFSGAQGFSTSLQTPFGFGHSFKEVSSYTEGKVRQLRAASTHGLN